MTRLHRHRIMTGMLALVGEVTPQLVRAGWRLSISNKPGAFIVSRDGPGALSYVGHNGNCYIEGTAENWRDLEDTLMERHNTAVRNHVVWQQPLITRASERPS